MARSETPLLDDITKFIRDAYRGDMSSFELMRRSVALSARIEIALAAAQWPVDGKDYTALMETLSQYKERIYQIIEARFVQKPDKPKWKFVGRDAENRLHFKCSNGSEQFIPHDIYWKTAGGK